jgi:hypothetical protein
MDVPSLEQDFYNAYILEANLGPRREVTLQMELWPKVNGERIPWTAGQGQGPLLEVRFGGIENFVEVSAFFESFSDSPNAHCGLHYLAYDETENPKPGRLVLEMEFDSTGDRLKIQCQKLTLTLRGQSPTPAVALTSTHSGTGQ